MPLNLKTQIDNHTCTTACIAMILDVPILSLLKTFHVKNLKGQITSSDFLRENGVNVTECNTLERVVDDGIYVLCVASLNELGALHNIILEQIDGKRTIYDPIKGTKGKRYYTLSKFDVSDEAFMLTQYAIDFKVIK
ncbi:hypothetical protein TSMG0002 [Halocynthia phage JM-2012]|uniref:hypothetical protein n=1 Tax=Halocynthia phage JM-2012 TaxID=1173297 RepID=UPI00025C68D1|nr:hypothetical protein TSMG0002 [Halocynthia phage JM-2012]AFI55285.1 hypothetical protein TSMG0002 [Halocynthia phage JM-2012]